MKYPLIDKFLKLEVYNWDGMDVLIASLVENRLATIVRQYDETFIEQVKLITELTKKIDNLENEVRGHVEYIKGLEEKCQ